MLHGLRRDQRARRTGVQDEGAGDAVHHERDQEMMAGHGERHHGTVLHRARRARLAMPGEESRKQDWQASSGKSGAHNAAQPGGLEMLQRAGAMPGSS